jgi:hypothetical protein
MTIELIVTTRTLCHTRLFLACLTQYIVDHANIVHFIAMHDAM